MNKKQFLILVFSILYSNLFAQSLATNILFGQASLVYKGRVEKISGGEGDAEGIDYGISTVVEKVYKGNYYEERKKFGVTKEWEENGSGLYNFQIKEGSTYIFFLFGGSLADNQVEGIPFSDALEKQFKLYKYSSHDAKIAFRVLFQSSPIATEAKVIRIKKRKNFNSILIMSDTGKKIKVKTKELHCISKEGTIKEGENYLFFLTTIDKRNYLLTDRWLGVFQLDSIPSYVLESYKKRRTANKK